MDNSIPETAPVTVKQILDRFVSEYIPHELAPRTARDYRRHVGHLTRLFGDRIASELKPKDFGPFLNIQGRGRTNRVRQLAVLSAAFSEAVSTWFWIDRNVLRDVKRPKSRPRDRLVTEEEFASVKASAPLRVRLAMEIAVITGQRQGDILNMQWADIKDMALHIYQGKTGKRLAIEITPDLEKVLDRCWQLPKGGCDGGEYVITRRCGGRYTFHDLRALAATRCPTIEHAMYLLGHSNISMTRRVYRRGIERVRPVPLSAAMSA